MDSPLAYVFADGNLPSLPLSCSSTSEELQQRLHSISLELESVREAAKLQSKLNESKLSQLQGMLETARKERDEAWLECVKLQECHFRLSSGTTSPAGTISATQGMINNGTPPSPCSLVQSISSASTSSTPKQSRQHPNLEAPLCLQQDMTPTTCIDDCMPIFDKDSIFPQGAGFVKHQTLPKLNTDVPILPKLSRDVPLLPKLNSDVPSLSKLNTDVPSLPKLKIDVPSLPKLNTDMPSLNTDIQKLKREMASLPKLSTDLSKLNSDALSSLPKLNSDMPSLPTLSTDMSSLSKLNSDISSLPKLSTDMSSFQKVSSDMSLLPKLNTDGSSLPKLGGDIFNDHMDLEQPKGLDANNIPIDPMVCDTAPSGKMKWESHLPTNSSSNGTLTRQSSCISSSGCLLIRQSSCLSSMVNSQSWDSVESPRMPATLAPKQSLPMPPYQMMAKQQPHSVQLGLEPHKAPPVLCRRPLFSQSQGLILPSAENIAPPFASESYHRSSAFMHCKMNDITDLVHRNTNIMPVLSTDKSSIYQTPMMLNKHDILQILQLDVKVKPGSLPEKGNLLQAVMQAGPLLQTLLLAGPLPEFKHPPPQLSTLDLPKLPQFSPNKMAPSYTNPLSPMSIVNNVRSITLPNTLGPKVPYGLMNGTNPVDLTSPFGGTAGMISSNSKMNMMDSAKTSFLRSRKLRKPNPPVAVR